MCAQFWHCPMPKWELDKCWIFPFTLSYVTEFRNFKRPEQIRTLRISAWNERWSLKIMFPIKNIFIFSFLMNTTFGMCLENLMYKPVPYHRSSSDRTVGMCLGDQHPQNTSFLSIFFMDNILTQYFHTIMTNIKCCSQTLFELKIKKWTSINTIWNQISPAAKIFMKKGNPSIFPCSKQ